MAKHDDVFTCASNFYKFAGFFLRPLKPGATSSELFFAAFTTQIFFKKFIGVIFTTQYHIACVCYAFDLVLTIRNPLFPASKRLRWYIVVGVITVLLSIIIEMNGIGTKPGANFGEKILANPRDKDIGSELISIIVLIIFIVVGTYSIIKALYSL